MTAIEYMGKHSKKLFVVYDYDSEKFVYNGKYDKAINSRYEEKLNKKVTKIVCNRKFTYLGIGRPE